MKRNYLWVGFVRLKLALTRRYFIVDDAESITQQRTTQRGHACKRLGPVDVPDLLK